MRFLFFLAIISVICLTIFTYHVAKKIEKFTEQKEIPRVIWTYWHEEQLPLVIQKCIATWKKHNPDYEIVVLNDKKLLQYLPDISFDNFRFVNTSHSRKSDMVRCNILAKYGGVWSDASIIMHKSLHELLRLRRLRSLHSDAEFVGYYLEKFTTNLDYPVIESWFFACVPGCKFMQMWKDTFLHMNDYDTIEDYVKYIKGNTDIQNIDSPDYLTIHIAAQYVLQNLMSKDEIKNNLYLQKAEDGPYKYLVDNEWDSVKAVDSLCVTKYDVLFHKLRGIERRIVQNNLEKYECLFS